MGKKSHGLPTIGEDAQEAIDVVEHPVSEKVDQEPQDAEELPVASELNLRLPFVKVPDGYQRRNFHCRLTTDQALTLKGILRALEDADARLKNGRYVSTQMHVFQWILENAV